MNLTCAIRIFYFRESAYQRTFQLTRTGISNLIHIKYFLLQLLQNVFGMCFTFEFEMNFVLLLINLWSLEYEWQTDESFCDEIKIRLSPHSKKCRDLR